ncbi:hypothetical protein [Ramlibacter albus]|uniref:Uncharacterized protein n=1 Tax=Ramlibacter albus TaxID=2079448 RepID=A0A923MER6_9BURK|nr:hypothetical protein [Ramlibacter albus]MBC5768685.1 hypothetical protein [Ramlibacter albus]
MNKRKALARPANDSTGGVSCAGGYLATLVEVEIQQNPWELTFSGCLFDPTPDELAAFTEQRHARARNSEGGAFFFASTGGVHAAMTKGLGQVEIQRALDEVAAAVSEIRQVRDKHLTGFH